MLRDLELCDNITIDTLTGETTSRSVYLKSGNREIYISVNTMVKINDFLRSKGVQV
ncbi:MAG: hypothetical protein WC547_09690 [Candidatus Omnitrophota bacterium]